METLEILPRMRVNITHAERSWAKLCSLAGQVRGAKRCDTVVAFNLGKPCNGVSAYQIGARVQSFTQPYC